jgi:hypothetical protein
MGLQTAECKKILLAEFCKSDPFTQTQSTDLASFARPVWVCPAHFEAPMKPQAIFVIEKGGDGRR